MRVFRRKDKVTKRPVGPWLAWWYDASGKRQQRSTKQTDRKAAEIIAAQWERDTADPRNATQAKATLEQGFNLFILRKQRDSKAGKASKHTVTFYTSKSGHWLRLLKRDFLLRDLTSAEVDGYIDDRRSEGASEHSISKELVTLRSMLKVALRGGLWRGDIKELLPRFDSMYKPRSTTLTHDQLWQLLRELTPARAGMVAFIVATGARLSEARSVKACNIQEDQVVLHGTKTENAERIVPIAAPWQRSLIKYAMQRMAQSGRAFRPWSDGSMSRDLHCASARAGCRISGHLGPNRQQLKYACDRMECKLAALPRISPNDLRRTFATWLRLDGVPLELIAPMMGHSTTTMVQQVYGKLTGNQVGALIQQCSKYAAVKTERVDVSGKDGQQTPEKNQEGWCPEPESNQRHKDFQSFSQSSKQSRKVPESPSGLIWPNNRTYKLTANMQQRKRGTK